ncbi:MAG: dihydrolipoamide acetyltransferase family protein [bacterium]
MARKALACPPLGVSVFTGILAQWYVKVGDPVAVEQPIWSVETDKVTQDVLSSMAGTFAEITVPEGDVVEPEMVVGYIETDANVVVGAPSGDKPAPEKKTAEKDIPVEEPPKKEAPAKEPATKEAPAKEPPPQETPASVPAEALAEANATTGDVTPAAAPAAKASSSKQAATTTAAPATSPAGSNGTHSSKTEKGTHRYSPRVRRLMRENKLTEQDLQTVQGSGREGRVKASDVERFIASGKRAEVAAPQAAAPAAPRPAAPVAATATAPEPAPTKHAVAQIPPIGGVMEESVEVQKLTTIRKTIATYLRNSVDNAVHCVSIDECDLTDLLAMRTRLNAYYEQNYGIKVALTAFIARAVALSLREFPTLNSQLDLEHDQVKTAKHIHLGIAVDAPQGLTVPVVRFADQLSILQLQVAISEVAEKVRAGKATLADLQGSTYTITNAGAIGSVASTPIINYPNVGILGVHKIRKMPVVRDNQVVIRDIVYFAGTFDHRLVDGVYNVRFMNRVIQFLESPELLLL